MSNSKRNGQTGNLDSEHKELKLTQAYYLFLQDRPVFSIFLSEVSLAALDLSLAFSSTDKGLSLVAILSLEKANNAQIGSKGHWMGGYMPMLIRNYPFSISLDGQQTTMLVDQDSKWLSKEEGDALFDQEGNPSEVLSKYMQNLKNIASSLQTEKLALKAIEDSGLLETWMEIPQKLFRVNPQSLYSLSDQKFVKLRKVGALPVIYAHIFSQHRLERIKNLAKQKQNMAQVPKATPSGALVDFNENVLRYST